MVIWQFCWNYARFFWFLRFSIKKNRAVKKQDKTKQNVITSGRMSVGVAISVLMLKKCLRGGVIYSGHECYLMVVTAGLEIKNHFNETKNFLNFKRLKRQRPDVKILLVKKTSLSWISGKKFNCQRCFCLPLQLELVFTVGGFGPYFKSW